jgi:hypothetical protein
MEPPSMILVNDENPYGLMVTLIFSYRFCPYAMRVPYVDLKVARISK